MNQELKSLVGDKKQLESILGVTRTQAWRIWNGKSNLTSVNEKLIRLVCASKKS